MAHRIARDDGQDREKTESQGEAGSVGGSARSVRGVRSRRSGRSRRLQRSPLGVRNGLNPTRVRIPESAVGGMRAVDVLTHMISTQRHRHPDDGERAIMQRFREGLVATVDGPCGPDDLLFPGQDLWFYRMPAPEKPLAEQCRVLFSDDHLLVVDKPAGMATMPRGRHQTQTALVQLRIKTANPDLVPAHRLDRLTSGTLVFIADPAVRGAYQSLFSKPGLVHKTYEALAAYDPRISAGTRWSSFMEKKVGDLQVRSTDTQPHNALTEVLAVEPLPGNPGIARYSLRPHTGKTHQLRRHMSDAGVPILGDPLYPVVQPEAEDDTTLHLMSRSISFIDPISGEERHFEAPRRW